MRNIVFVSKIQTSEVFETSDVFMFRVKKMTKSIISWKTEQILEATKGELIFGDTQKIFSNISIDSRKITPDEIFAAIVGEVHDGHKFVSDVLNSGVRGVIINKNRVNDFSCTELKDKGIICIAVENTTKALGDLAAFHRKRLNIKVIAITGSNGKTTTREMTAAVVSQRFKTLTPQKNFNNEIGVPLTLFNLTASHECAVLELGMNHAGEIRRLTEICQPDIGVITNIGPAHIGMLGSMDAIMHAKGELLEKIKPGGTAVLNIDDQRVAALGNQCSEYGIKKFFYSKTQNPKAHIHAISIREERAGISFTLVLPEKNLPVRLELPGGFMVLNSLAAASIGYLMGLTAQEILQGLESFKPVQGRMNIRRTEKGTHIIDDTYNANLESVKAALSAFKSLKEDKRGIFVSGDMLELGEYSESMHRELGKAAAGSGIARLYAFGNFAENVAEGAISEGEMDSEYVVIGTKKEIIENLKKELKPDDWILVKGSRGMKMEDIVNALMIDC